MQKIKKMTKIRTIVLMLALMVIPSAAIAAENYMSLLDQIDDYRFKHRVASRAEAIRQLIQKGLATAEE